MTSATNSWRSRELEPAAAAERRHVRAGKRSTIGDVTVTRVEPILYTAAEALLPTTRPEALAGRLDSALAPDDDKFLISTNSFGRHRRTQDRGHVLRTQIG